MVKVLVFNHHYLPGYKSGGALRTIVNMVEQIGEKVDFKIVTSDRDLGDQKMYDGINIDQWSKVGNALVNYQKPDVSLFEIVQLVKNTSFDVIYLNSFFDYDYSIKILFVCFFLRLTKPIIIAPRGEFSKGAMDIKKIKKNIYLIVAKLAGVYDKVTWQASSEYEEEDIIRVGMPNNIIVVPDMPALFKYESNSQQDSVKLEGELNICFISRISRMKNLDFALNVLANMEHSVKFDIYGPVEDEQYWSKCESIINSMPDNVIVNYCGIINHCDVVDTFSKYDLFFFPTHGENYGHVIIESMSAGTPVLISDNTPWLDLSEHNAGYVASLINISGFISFIAKLAMMNSYEYSELRLSAHRYAKKILNNHDVNNKNINMFSKFS